MSNPQGRDQPVCARCGIHGCTWCAWSLQMEARDPAPADPGGRLMQRSPKPVQRSPRAIKRMNRAEYIATVVAAAPPLSPGQTQRLQAILVATAPALTSEQKLKLQGVLLSAGHGPERAPELDAQRPSTRFSKSIPSFGETGDTRTLAPPADIRSSEPGDS